MSSPGTARSTRVLLSLLPFLAGVPCEARPQSVWEDGCSVPGGGKAVAVDLGDRTQLLVHSPGKQMFGTTRSSDFAWWSDAGWEALDPPCPVFAAQVLLSVDDGRRVVVAGRDRDSRDLSVTWKPGESSWSALGPHVEPIGWLPGDDGGAIAGFGNGGQGNGVYRWVGGAWELVTLRCRLDLPYEGGPAVAQESTGYNPMLGASVVELEEGATLVGGLQARGQSGNAGCVVRWTGESWERVGSFLDTQPWFFASVSVDGVPRLVAAGGFTKTLDGRPLSGPIFFDGADWSELGGGARRRSGAREYSTVDSLHAVHGPDGPALYAFGQALGGLGDVDVHCAARWDGTGWEAVGPVGGRAFRVEDFVSWEEDGESRWMLMVREEREGRDDGYAGLRALRAPGEASAFPEPEPRPNLDLAPLPERLLATPLQVPDEGSPNLLAIDDEGRAVGLVQADPHPARREHVVPLLSTTAGFEVLPLPEGATNTRSVTWDGRGGILATFYRDGWMRVPVPYRYEDGEWRSLVPEGTPATFSHVYGTDAEGRPLVGYSSRDVFGLYRVEPDGSHTLVPSPDGRSWFPLEVRGDLVAAHWIDPQGCDRVCLLRGESIEVLELPGIPRTYNRHGLVAGQTAGTTFRGGLQAFLQNGTVYVPLDHPDDDGGWPAGITDEGLVVLGANAGTRAGPPFLLTNGTESTALDPLVEGASFRKPAAVVAVSPGGKLLTYLDRAPYVLAPGD